MEEVASNIGETTSATETAISKPTRIMLRLTMWGQLSLSRFTGEPRKFYFDGGQVAVVAYLVHELDPNGSSFAS